MIEHNKDEVVWIADGIRAMLIATNGTDKFPEAFYKEAKRLIKWGGKI